MMLALHESRSGRVEVVEEGERTVAVDEEVLPLEEAIMPQLPRTPSTIQPPNDPILPTFGKLLPSTSVKMLGPSSSQRPSNNDATNATTRYEDFSSPWYITTLGYTLVMVMLVANMYVLVELGLGKGG